MGVVGVRWTSWLWTRLLLLVDVLLGSHLVEWELSRRQHKIERLLAAMDDVNQELDDLKETLALSQLVVCLIELKARSERADGLNQDWLLFAPHEDDAEDLLDVAIEYLVKPGLAKVETTPAGPRQYVYRLDPDWGAVLECVRDRPGITDLMGWLEEQAQSQRAQHAPK
jgi:hypothetical protein